MNIIALDLGGTKLAAALFDESGAALHRLTFPLAGKSGSDVGLLIQQAIEALNKFGAPSAIGVAVPGIARTATGTVWAPNIPGWNDYPLLDELRAKFPNVPVVIESDRTCYIMGEVWRGNARGAHNAIFLAVGTGIGAGILADGRVLRGQHDIAGAIGWLALDRPYEDKYRNCGCFEYYAAGPGIGHAAQERGLANASTEDVFAAYHSGDARAKEVIEAAINYWGMAVANLVSLFNPEIIVFGGGVFGPATALLDRIYDEAFQWAQPISIHQVKLVPSALGSDAGVYGAAYCALNALHSTPTAIIQ